MIFKSLAFQEVTVSREAGMLLLDKVDFEFPLGKLVQIRGPQGSGVSTLLQVLAGLLEPRIGSYLINGTDIARVPAPVRYQYQLSIGYGFDSGGLISNCSLRENLLLPILYNKTMNQERAEETANQWLERFHIMSSKDLLPAHATSTARKCCLLARAFILKPELVILDQPTQGLHKQGIQTLIDLIKDNRKTEITKHLFVATEDTELLEALDFEAIDIANKKLHTKRGAHASAA